MLTRAIVITAATIAPAQARGASFEFVRPSPQEPHIALQPFQDYHRIRCAVRIRHNAGKMVYGRLTVEPTDEGGPPAAAADKLPKTSKSHTFKVKTDNDLWLLYFRVRRYGNRDMEYTLTIGRYMPFGPERRDITSPDEYFPETGFRWRIERNPTAIATVDQNGEPFPVYTTVRRLVVEQGVVKVVREVRAEMNRLELREVLSRVPRDGDELISRIN